MAVEAEMPIHCDGVPQEDKGHALGGALPKWEVRDPLQLRPQLECAGRCGAKFVACWLKCLCLVE